MSGGTNGRSLKWIAVKSLIFTVGTLLATGMLALTIRNSDPGGTNDYTAMFTDATSVNKGDDVRMAGVKVGTVQSIGIGDDRLAEVKFTVSKDVRLSKGTVVQIRFRNLVGQRYLALLQPPLPGSPASNDSGWSTDVGGTSEASSTTAQAAASTTSAHSASATAGETIPPGHTFEEGETRPALDLTLLFNGFRPLLRLLNPDDVNQLSEQIVAVFQGEGATVEGLLQSTASLTSTLADKDQVIGELISSLSSVLTTVNDRTDQLDTTLVTMQQLVSGLNEDRTAIGGAIEGMGKLTTSVSDLLHDTRPALRKSIEHLDVLSTNLDDNSDDLEKFLQRLPTKLDTIGRTASYGSWVNFYLCSMKGRIPMPQGYMGDLGVKPVAGRCR
jgi:phospholipid/cholesterol/gamma-HCH transport system substrate-binding protein